MKVNKISGIMDHIQSAQNKLRKGHWGSTMPSIALSLFEVHPTRKLILHGLVAAPSITEEELDQRDLVMHMDILGKVTSVEEYIQVWAPLGTKPKSVLKSLKLKGTKATQASGAKAEATPAFEAKSAAGQAKAITESLVKALELTGGRTTTPL